MSDLELRLKEAEAKLTAAQILATARRSDFVVAQRAYFAAAEDPTQDDDLEELKEDRITAALDYAEAADALATALEARDDLQLDAYGAWIEQQREGQEAALDQAERSF